MLLMMNRTIIEMHDELRFDTWAEQSNKHNCDEYKEYPRPTALHNYAIDELDMRKVGHDYHMAIISRTVDKIERCGEQRGPSLGHRHDP
jgi:hypothetical protein